MSGMDKPEHYFIGEEAGQMNESMHFGLSIDCVVFGFQNGKIRVLLIERGVDPYKDSWALPGNLVSPNDALRDSANKILRQLTGLEKIYLEQFFTFGSLDRHPAGRVVTVGYYALVNSDRYNPIASSWAKQIDWMDINELPALAFDHQNILDKAIVTLKKKVRTEPIGFNLLPKKFTLLELQGLYEALLGYKFDKPNFRKKILDMNLLISLNELQTNVPHRPAKLYSFDPERYESLKNKGFNFEI